MILLRDEGSVYDVPLDEVLGYLGSGAPHSAAHGHRKVRRSRPTAPSGRYSWEQSFEGARRRFSMRWTSYLPLGLAYDVLAGPFAGSRFFLYYEPLGDRTGVGLLGAFTSEEIPPSRLESSVRRFFAVEFDEDRQGLEAWRSARPSRRRDR